MSDCKSRGAMISAFIDGELSDEESAELMEHMAQCNTCSQAFAAFSMLSESINEAEELPNDLHDRIMSSVKAEERRKKRRSAWIPMLSAAACVALVIFVGSRVDMSENSSDMTAPEETADQIVNEAFNGDEALDYGSVTAVGSKISGAELQSLLAPTISEDCGNERYYDDETVYEIYIEANAETPVCTVLIAGSEVYADFGEGFYLTSCSPDELMEIIDIPIE